MTLERMVRSLLDRALPSRVASEAAAELLEEYRGARQSRGRVIAAVVLGGETAAIMAPFMVSALQRLVRSSTVLQRELAHGWRALRRRPVSSLAAILMLSAGLTAVATATGLAATLLRPINPRFPGEVRRITSLDVAGRVRLAFSEIELSTIRDSLAGTATIVAANLQPVVLRNGDTELQTLAEVVAGRYFDTMGLGTAAGRPLLERDALSGAAPVVVISDVLWRDWFGRDPAALGATVAINGRPFTIVGVAAGPSTSSLLSGSVDAWLSVAHADAMLDRTWRTNPDYRWWTVLASFDPAIGARVETALQRATADLVPRLPDVWRERRILLAPGTVLAGSQRNTATTLAIILIAFAVSILAAAAANVSGLFLAAAASARGRAAIQLAIGSGRAAVLRRHLIEGAMVGGAAGAAAVAGYLWIGRRLEEVTLLPTLSLRLDLPFDLQVAIVTITAGMAAGLCLALGPGLWLSRLDVAQALRDGASRSSAGLSRSRRLLVAFQVAISITLVASATQFARTAAALSSLDVGFPRDGLIAMDFDLEPATPASAELPPLAREALSRAASVPGVIAAAMSNRAPIDSSTPAVTVEVPGSAEKPLADVTYYLATEMYFETVGLALAAGRRFNADEVAREADVVIVNETLARRLWPNGDALDSRVRLLPQARTVRVVGVAEDSKYRSLSEAVRPHLYLPAPPGFGRSLLVRTRNDPRQTLLAVQSELRGLGPGIVGFFPRTLTDHVAGDVLPTRVSANAAGVLAVLALALSAAGLYGIVTWFVEVRRREIGVRVALGATRGSVRWMIVRQAVAAAAPGLVAGVMLSAALTFLGRSLFVGIGPADPLAVLAGTAAIAVVVAAASYWPSRKATRIDPIIVLRDS